MYSKIPLDIEANCNEIIVMGNPRVVGGGMAFKIHDKYNGADDECMYEPTPYTPPNNKNPSHTLHMVMPLNLFLVYLLHNTGEFGWGARIRT